MCINKILPEGMYSYMCLNLRIQGSSVQSYVIIPLVGLICFVYVTFVHSYIDFILLDATFPKIIIVQW